MPDSCIECKSYNISADGGVSEGDWAWFEVRCLDCGTEWTEHYKLSSVVKKE
jgi:hypothetical protein